MKKTINQLLRAPLLITAVAFITMGAGCGQQPSRQAGTKTKEALSPLSTPHFNADSAYHYVQKQVNFGPRVPNTQAHEACARWLSEKMKGFGAQVEVQEGKVTAFDNTILHIKNIIAQFQPEKNDRILLFAHWDTRPFADHDPDPAKRNTPIDGANDGASGVGVLMEIARHLNNNPTHPGVDIIFFDAEDYGMPDHRNLPYKKDTWCLGSQYWGKNRHKKNYYARYGILLDMVGAKNARFYQEQYSLQWAPRLVDHIWNTAAKIGYSNFFIFNKGGYITDDHVYVNKLTGIQTVDIIQYDPASNTSFGNYWHTHNDNMDVIDPTTLKAVGQTVLEVIYQNEY
ncbi:M28 family peptidase [Thermophagus sp. OGC60D27]|uniref:M28 family peptidase n=1 Tax=Thermophagus sp. OGC60D27 TaxID=3458415 RepID=UPI004037C5D1